MPVIKTADKVLRLLQLEPLDHVPPVIVGQERHARTSGVVRAAGLYSGRKSHPDWLTQCALVNRKQAEQSALMQAGQQALMRGVLIALKRRISSVSLFPKLLFQRAAFLVRPVELKRLMPPHARPTWSHQRNQRRNYDRHAMPRLLPHDAGSGNSDLPPPVGISTSVTAVDHIHDDRLRSPEVAVAKNSFNTVNAGVARGNGYHKCRGDRAK
jgi:hypothetical protein